MIEEKFDYEGFANNIYEQALELMPDDISAEDKEALAAILKQYSQMTVIHIINNFKIVDTNSILFTAQIIAEWIFHKGVDIIRAGVPKSLREKILQDVAFVIYKTCNTGKETEQEKLITNVEKAVKNEFKKVIKILHKNNLISDEILLRAEKLSNIDSITSL